MCLPSLFAPRILIGRRYLPSHPIGWTNVSQHFSEAENNQLGIRNCICRIFQRGMDDHILKRLGQDEAASAWWSCEMKSDDCEESCEGGGEEQHMLQLDGSTGEVNSSRGRGGKRRGRLKNGFVNGKVQKKKTFLEGGGGDRGVGVKRKRGRPRKIQEKPGRVPEEEVKNCYQ